MEFNVINASLERVTELCKTAVGDNKRLQREADHMQCSLEIERRSRRILQLANEELQQKLNQQKYPFIIVLIDADTYVFHERFLQRTTGGAEAADALHSTLEQFAAELGLSSATAIHAKAFGNVTGLGNVLAARRVLTNANQLRSFVAGFSNGKGFFDFIDVGNNKDSAAFKLQANISAYISNPQCLHIVLACGQKAIYSGALGALGELAGAARRITLLERSTFLPEIRSLGFEVARFDGIFHD